MHGKKSCRTSVWRSIKRHVNAWNSGWGGRGKKKNLNPNAVIYFFPTFLIGFMIIQEKIWLKETWPSREIWEPSRSDQTNLPPSKRIEESTAVRFSYGLEFYLPNVNTRFEGYFCFRDHRVSWLMTKMIDYVAKKVTTSVRELGMKNSKSFFITKGTENKGRNLYAKKEVGVTLGVHGATLSIILRTNALHSCECTIFFCSLDIVHEKKVTNFIFKTVFTYIFKISWTTKVLGSIPILSSAWHTW